MSKYIFLKCFFKNVLRLYILYSLILRWPYTDKVVQYWEISGHCTYVSLKLMITAQIIIFYMWKTRRLKYMYRLSYYVPIRNNCQESFKQMTKLKLRIARSTLSVIQSFDVYTFFTDKFLKAEYSLAKLKSKVKDGSGRSDF